VTQLRALISLLYPQKETNTVSSKTFNFEQKLEPVASLYSCRKRKLKTKIEKRDNNAYLKG
jgi:hypothetical protein